MCSKPENKILNFCLKYFIENYTKKEFLIGVSPINFVTVTCFVLDEASYTLVDPESEELFGFKLKRSLQRAQTRQVCTVCYLLFCGMFLCELHTKMV